MGEQGQSRTHFKRGTVCGVLGQSIVHCWGSSSTEENGGWRTGHGRSSGSLGLGDCIASVSQIEGR